MTNNNWIEEFQKNFSSYIKTVSIGQYNDAGVNIGFLSAEEVIKHFVSNILTQKDQEIEKWKNMSPNSVVSYENGYSDGKKHADQEHKAELEMIKGEIESNLSNCKGNFYCEECKLDSQEEYNKTLQEIIAIIDSHINKLST